MPDVVPVRLICDVPAFQVKPVKVKTLNAVELPILILIVEAFKLIVRVADPDELKDVDETA